MKQQEDSRNNHHENGSTQSLESERQELSRVIPDMCCKKCSSLPQPTPHLVGITIVHFLQSFDLHPPSWYQSQYALVIQ